MAEPTSYDAQKGPTTREYAPPRRRPLLLLSASPDRGGSNSTSSGTPAWRQRPERDGNGLTQLLNETGGIVHCQTPSLVRLLRYGKGMNGRGRHDDENVNSGVT